MAKIDPITMEYLRKTQELQDKIRDLEKERIEKIFTLENARAQYTDFGDNLNNFNVKWSEDLEGEEIKVYGPSDDGKDFFIKTIHVDALWNHTWENMDYSCVSEIWLTKEEVNHIKELMDGGD